MKKLLNTLYVTSPEAYLSLDGENVVVIIENTEKLRVPLHNIQSIVAFNYTGASPALMYACAKRNISIDFMKPNGRFLARVVGEVKGNVLLRKRQYFLSEEPHCLLIAKNIITGKLFNSRWVIERAVRDYPLRLDVGKLREKSSYIKDMMHKVQEAENLDEVRGIEGNTAKAYFGLFDDLILQQKEEFYFNTRSKRPPLDNVNAMLSFMYSIHTYEIASALETVGLDPYVGFLHRDRPGRVSLALDLLEEFRHVLIDRFVITLINKREVGPSGFTKAENGAVKMDDDTRKIILSAWQQRKQESIVHPFLKEKISWGLAAHVQAMLLARYIRGDLDEYPPFLWK